MWDDARRIRSTHFRPENTEHVRWGMALTEAELFPIEYFQREIELARELGSHKISAHAGFGESSRHTRYVERLAAAGALDSDLLFVHGWSLSDHELELMVRPRHHTGGNAGNRIADGHGILRPWRALPNSAAAPA